MGGISNFKIKLKNTIFLTMKIIHANYRRSMGKRANNLKIQAIRKYKLPTTQRQALVAF